MMTHYASMTKSLLGIYYPLPVALCIQDCIPARIALNTSDLQKHWCDVYTREKTLELIEEFGGVMLPDEFAERLMYDSYELQMGLKGLKG